MTSTTSKDPAAHTGQDAALTAPTPTAQHHDRIRAKTVQGLLDLFDDRASGDAFLNDLIAVFVSTGHEALSDLRSALSTNDRGRLMQLGHKLKGLGRNIGAERLASLCHLLETSAGNPASDVQSLSAAISSEFDDACEQLRADYGRGSAAAPNANP